MVLALGLVLLAVQSQAAPAPKTGVAQPALAPARAADPHGPRALRPAAVPLLPQAQSPAQAAQERQAPPAQNPQQPAAPAQPVTTQPRPQSGRPPPPVIDQPQSGGNTGCSCDLLPCRDCGRPLMLACAILGGMLLGLRRWR